MADETRIEGYRYYQLNEQLTLEGATGYAWEKDHLYAKCNLQSFKEYADFQQHMEFEPCTCGIWALYDREILKYPARFPTFVEALVSGWGTVIEFDLGWRASFVKIEKLFIYHPKDYYFTQGLSWFKSIKEAIKYFNSDIATEEAAVYGIRDIRDIANFLQQKYGVPVELLDNGYKPYRSKSLFNEAVLKGIVPMIAYFIGVYANIQYWGNDIWITILLLTLNIGWFWRGLRLFAIRKIGKLMNKFGYYLMGYRK